MSDEQGDDIGPDPHLNQRGVALTAQQRRTLGITGALIGTGLVLVLVGLMYAAPPGWSLGGAATAAPVRIVLTGPARALVTVEQDGAATPETEVALPYRVPIADGTGVVSVEARGVGRGGAGAIRCAVVSGTDGAADEVRRADDSGVVRCGAALR